jgi:quercetin dioxygenase-like cupin family protein
VRFIAKEEGETYSPEGHDETVCSRSLLKGGTDVHVTTFPKGAGMKEEVHPQSGHVFYVLVGTVSVLQGGKVLKKLGKDDAVYIPAGETHEIRNDTEADATFIAITFPQ